MNTAFYANELSSEQIVTNLLKLLNWKQIWSANVNIIRY